MDKITQYRKAIIQVLTDYQSQFRLTSKNLQYQTLIDKDNNHYQFLWTGWDGDRHVFSIAFHIDIIGDKIWIQEDNTEIGIADLLVEQGIAKSDIVLAYFAPSHRELTEFAVE